MESVGEIVERARAGSRWWIETAWCEFRNVTGSRSWTVLPPSAHKLPSVWASRRDLERNKRGNNGRVWFELVMDSLLIGGRVYVWVQVRESWLAAKWRSRLGQY